MINTKKQKIKVHDGNLKTNFQFQLKMDSASECRIDRFYDKKVVTCYPLCPNINIWKLLAMLVVFLVY